MRRSTVRASRLSGTPSNEVDRGAPVAARATVEYWCHADHLTAVTLDSAADPPPRWDCGTCGSPALQERGQAPRADRPQWFPKTPYEFLMMRRTVEEGEQLLAEALAELRARRAAAARR